MRDDEHNDRKQRRDRDDALKTRRSALVVAHLVAAVRPQVPFEPVLDQLPGAQANVAARVIVHVFVQVEHHFVLLVALVTPVHTTCMSVRSR